MSGARGLLLGSAALAIAACASEPTGVRVHVHLGAIAFDELHFGVIEPGASGSEATTLVDPDTLGRKTGPFRAGDQDIVILLRDDLDGREIFCDVAAFHGAAVTGTGDGAVLAQAHRIRDLDIFLTATGPADGGAPGDAAIPDDGGAGAGGGGGGGDGGNDGAGGARGSGGGGRPGSDGGTGGGGAGGAAGIGGAGGSGSGGSGTGGRGTGGAGVGGSPVAPGTGGASAGTGALGSPCTVNGQCSSLHCVETVCCESACDTACSTCRRNNGQAGQCRPSQFGTTCTPPCADAQDRFNSGACGVTGTCLGLGAHVACPAPQPSCIAGVCR